MSELVIEDAAFNDHAAVAALLDAAGLPVPGERDRPVRMLVARRAGGRAGKVVGCVGWERAGDEALLRSFAVAEAERRAGVGSALVVALVDRLTRDGVGAVYLLTIGARAFFEARDFRVVSRDQVSDAVRGSHEFVLHHCDSAVCMVKHTPAYTSGGLSST